MGEGEDKGQKGRQEIEDTAYAHAASHDHFSERENLAEQEGDGKHQNTHEKRGQYFSQEVTVEFPFHGRGA